VKEKYFLRQTKMEMICEVLQEKGKGYRLQTQCGIGKTIKNKKKQFNGKKRELRNRLT